MSKGIFYFFVKKDAWGANIIRWGTKKKNQKINDTPSHMGIVINGMWSIDSTVSSGVEMDYFPEYIKDYDIIKIFKDLDEKRSPKQVAVDLMVRSRKTKYDWMAVLYYAYRKLLNKFFNISIPSKNKWESKDRWFCNEIYELITNKDYSMTSPNDVMDEMSHNSRFKSVELHEILLDINN